MIRDILNYLKEYICSDMPKAVSEEVNKQARKKLIRKIVFWQFYKKR